MKFGSSFARNARIPSADQLAAEFENFLRTVTDDDE